MTDKDYVGKLKLKVIFNDTEGDTVEGYIFHYPEERLSDVVNKNERFLTLANDEGIVAFLNKDHITYIREAPKQ